MKTRHLAILACFVATAACRPKVKPAAEPAAPAMAKTVTAAQTIAAPKPAPKPVSQCTDDRQCTEYLRCEEGECKVPPAVDGREVKGMPTAAFTKADKVLATFKLEIADEPWERTRGLMYRRKMDPGFGMLFIFNQDDLRSFWMKNTLIPLDMVHINSKGDVVGVVASAAPSTLSPRQTGEPARYVLELTSGRAAEVGIEKGAKMSLTGLPPSQSPQ